MAKPTTAPKSKGKGPLKVQVHRRVTLEQRRFIDLYLNGQKKLQPGPPTIMPAQAAEPVSTLKRSNPKPFTREAQTRKKNKG